MGKNSENISQHKRMAMGEKVTGMKNGGNVKKMQDGGMTMGRGTMKRDAGEAMPVRRRQPDGALNRPGLAEELAIINGKGQIPPGRRLINEGLRLIGMGNAEEGMKNGGMTKRGKKC